MSDITLKAHAAVDLIRDMALGNVSPNWQVILANLVTIQDALASSPPSGTVPTLPSAEAAGVPDDARAALDYLDGKGQWDFSRGRPSDALRRLLLAASPSPPSEPTVLTATEAMVEAAAPKMYAILFGEDGVDDDARFHARQVLEAGLMGRKPA